MVSFWFRYVSRAQSLVNAGRGERYYDSVVLVGECKFRNQRFDMRELDKLRDKVDLLPMRAPALAAFSLGGFTSEVMAEDILAVDIEAMYR